MNALPYMTLASGVSTTGGALWLGPDNIRTWAMTIVVTGTLTGSFKFYASDDPRARPDHPDRANAKWVEFTADVASQFTNPAGSATTLRVKFIDYASDFLRMDYVHSSGSGTVTAYFSGRS